MNGANAALVLDLLIRYTQAATALTQMLNNARNEGRDVSSAEILSLATQDDIARQELDSAIIAAKARESGQ